MIKTGKMRKEVRRKHYEKQAQNKKRANGTRTRFGKRYEVHTQRYLAVCVFSAGADLSSYI